MKDRTPIYKPKNHLRIITAASLFDGHDAAINVMRRIMQTSGAEVIHLGHNRSVEEIVNTAIQEDAQAIAITSYQGGHIEFFKYIYDLLQKKQCGHIKIFGGGGGTILTDVKAWVTSRALARLISAMENEPELVAPIMEAVHLRLDGLTHPPVL